MMHKVQRDVEAFHRDVDGIGPYDTIEIRRPALRAELICEEAAETICAIEEGDLLGVIDGLCDLLYVTYGTAAEFGIDLEPFYEEVHRTNMLKANGPVSASGKRLKPPGWVKPDVQRILDGLA